MRPSLLPTPAARSGLRSAIRALALTTMTTLLAGAAVAATRIEAIAEPAAGQPGCGFRTLGPPPAGGRLVLFWSGARGTMNVNGKTVALAVTATPCRADCVAPGKSGTRVYRLRSGSDDDVQATLTTPVQCARDAEVCSGLLANNARLAVTAAGSKALLHVRNEDCDD